MASWKVGDWVFAYFEEEGYWYPASIVRIKGNEFTVRYDYDDSEEVLSADFVQEYSTYAGEKGAESWWEEDEGYYAVTVKEVNGEEVLVEYEDGSAEWTDLSNLRFEGE